MSEIQKKNKNYICVFDCESIPDAALIRKIYGFKGSDEEVSLMAIEAQKKEYASEFLPLPFHKIVSICAVICDEFGKFIKVNKIEGENEREMISNFFAFINKSEPKLVSFNGKNFDMPVLVLRALKYNIKANAYLDTISDKWNNYKSRYNEQKHCDLLESFGARVRLDSICSMANLPGKYDIHGSEVMKLFYQNNLDKIHEYCESDVLNTYMLFLKYELIKGNLSEEDYVQNLQIMAEYISTHKGEQGYVKVFVKACEDEIERIVSGNYEDNAFENSSTNLSPDLRADENAPSLDELIQSGALNLGVKATKTSKKTKKQGEKE